MRGVGLQRGAIKLSACGGWEVGGGWDGCLGCKSSAAGVPTNAGNVKTGRRGKAAWTAIVFSGRALRDAPLNPETMRASLPGAEGAGATTTGTFAKHRLHATAPTCLNTGVCRR